MKLSFSNIAWGRAQDAEMYEFLQAQGFTGLEIAPTRIFPDKPYEKPEEAGTFARQLKQRYGLTISSLQSIWYGRHENLFGGPKERKVLIAYTKKAADFAAAMNCGNLVFGCPKNRNMPAGARVEAAVTFFSEIVAYAMQQGTAIALEPNPSIYGTNFINHTQDAIAFAREIEGLRVNVDFGTIVENGESLEILGRNLDIIHHIHISEPNLAQIEKRGLHRELREILKGGYDRYVSVEMKNLGDLDAVKQTAEYVRGVFA